MLPSQLSPSSSSSSSSSMSSSGISTSQCSAPPVPDLLNVSSSGSAPHVDLGLLPLSMLLAQPPMLGWWVQATSNPMVASTSSRSSSSSSSSSISDTRTTGRTGRIRKLEQFSPDTSSTATKRSKQSRDKADPKQISTGSECTRPVLSTGQELAPTATGRFKQAALYLSRISLFKSQQKLRDEELQHTLDWILPTVLIDLVGQYAPELSLMPLEQGTDGAATTSTANRQIAKAVIEMFSSSAPDCNLFQNQIIENHGRRLLTTYFTGAVSAAKNVPLLRLVAAQNPAALQQRRGELRTVMNYLPYSECEAYLKAEMEGPGIGYVNQKEMETLQAVNVHLMFEAMQNIQPGFVKDGNRLDNLNWKKAGYLLKLAQAQFENGNIEKTQQALLQALEIFCQLNKKREAIQTVVKLIEWRQVKQSDNMQEVLDLFSTAKKLCLHYPVEAGLYADLLFAMNRYSKGQSNVVVLQQLYQQAEKEMPALPTSYRARFLYNHIAADYRAGESGLTAMRRINSALDFCCTIVRSSGSIDTRSDLSYEQFNNSVSLLFRLAAEITNNQLIHVDQMSDQQYVELISLIKYNVHAERFMYSYNHRLYPSLSHVGATAGVNLTNRSQLVSVGTAFYKNALKFMLGDFGIRASKETRALFVTVFGELVEFYRNTGNMTALELLLDKKNVTQFVKAPEFKAHMPDWRKVLREMKKPIWPA